MKANALTVLFVMIIANGLAGVWLVMLGSLQPTIALSSLVVGVMGLLTHQFLLDRSARYEEALGEKLASLQKDITQQANEQTQQINQLTDRINKLQAKGLRV